MLRQMANRQRTMRLLVPALALIGVGAALRVGVHGHEAALIYSAELLRWRHVHYRKATGRRLQANLRRMRIGACSVARAIVCVRWAGMGKNSVKSWIG